MNWVQVRALSWGLTSAVIIGTLYLSQIGLVRDALLTLVLVVEGTLVAGMILYEMTRWRERVDIRIASRVSADRLFLEVQSMNKTLKNARVRCNDVSYDWEGSGSNQKDIFVGEEPSVFCPFTHKWEWVEKDNLEEKMTGTSTFHSESVSGSPQEPKGGVLLSVSEAKSGKAVFRFLVTVSDDYAMILKRGNVPLQRFPISIRIIAEGIEEEREYPVQIELDNLWLVNTPDGKPAVKYGLQIGQKQTRSRSY